MPHRRREALTVGVAQLATELGHVEANAATHVAIIEEARERGVQCLLFPEMSLTGHSAGGWALEIAMARRHPIVRELAEAAGDMAVTFGLIEEGPAAQFYNSAYTVRGGSVVHIHRKINLATYGALEDGKHFAAGRYVESFGLGERWQGATLICNDLWNPALVHLAALHGATILLAPVSSAMEAVGAEFDNPGGWETACRYQAMVYGMPVLFANRTGTEQGLTFWGGSRIVDPFGRTVATVTEGERLAVAELSYDAVRRARYALPTVRDSNLDLLAREVERLKGQLGVPATVRPPGS